MTMRCGKLARTPRAEWHTAYVNVHIHNGKYYLNQKVEVTMLCTSQSLAYRAHGFDQPSPLLWMTLSHVAPGLGYLAGEAEIT